MSQMEYNAGVLTYLSEDAKGFAENYVRKNKVDMGGYEDSLDWFRGHCSDIGYEVINDRVFSVQWGHREEECPPELLRLNTDDGYTFTFATYHYNGSHWTEVLQGALEEQLGDNK